MGAAKWWQGRQSASGWQRALNVEVAEGWRARPKLTAGWLNSGRVTALTREEEEEEGNGVPWNSRRRQEAEAETEQMVAIREARRLLRLVQVEEIKQRLSTEERQCIPYADLLRLCSTLGVATSAKEAARFATALDTAGVILIFKDTVFLHPHRVAQNLAKAIPSPNRSPLLQELSRLQNEKQEIDRLAHRHARSILSCGLVYLTLQTAAIFRLTFWDLSWDIMEPIAYFATTIGLLLGYAFFLFTSRDPTYQDLMSRLLVSKQRKLIKQRNFDIRRLTELQKQCCISTSSSAFLWQHATVASPAIEMQSKSYHV